MPFSSSDARRLADVSALAHHNPFSPGRVAIERKLLGDRYRDDVDPRTGGPNTAAIHEDVTIWVGDLIRPHRRRDESFWRSKQTDAPEVWSHFEDTLLWIVFHDTHLDVTRFVAPPIDAEPPTCDAARWSRFRKSWRRLVGESPLSRCFDNDPAHVFAVFDQIRRAHDSIDRFVSGDSPAVAALRARIWESVFTHDLRAYRDGLYCHMAQFATLVTGPSGTGKELVARAVGMSRYVPFDPVGGRFADDPRDGYAAIAPAAMSPTLIESELFGHARGSFTGANAARVGWFERCPETGAVFLDEIGDLDAGVQVKLLRLMQQREFARVGETKLRRFRGRLIAATNRDLAADVREGCFREDLYYRLCADRIEVPSLRRRIAEHPGELRRLIGYLGRRLFDADDASIDRLERQIRDSVGDDYDWPGNVRELEQALRNCVLRGRYVPLGGDDHSGDTDAAEGPVTLRLPPGGMTADELVRAYARSEHRRLGNYAAAARSLGLDRRTVRSYVNGDGED